MSSENTVEGGSYFLCNYCDNRVNGASCRILMCNKGICPV
jgi:hypothetical protein